MVRRGRLREQKLVSGATGGWHSLWRLCFSGCDPRYALLSQSPQDRQHRAAVLEKNPERSPGAATPVVLRPRTPLAIPPCSLAGPVPHPVANKRASGQARVARHRATRRGHIRDAPVLGTQHTASWPRPGRWIRRTVAKWRETKHTKNECPWAKKRSTMRAGTRTKPPFESMRCRMHPGHAARQGRLQWLSCLSDARSCRFCVDGGHQHQ